MKFSSLEFSKAVEHPEMVAGVVVEALKKMEEAPLRPEDFGGAREVGVAEIDPTLSDTAAFCEKYQVGLGESANCVILKAKKKNPAPNETGNGGGENTTEEIAYVACVILATTRADVNGLVRDVIGTKKISFAPMEEAVDGSKMEFGAITPVGLPASWPILIDKAVAEAPALIIGSGVRKSKLLVSGKFLAGLPNVQVLEGLGQSKI